MSERKDGDPAFPMSVSAGPAGDVEWGNEGMSLRDYFACHAPWAPANFLGDPTPEAIVRVASLMAHRNYAYADAMLAERERK